MRLQRKRKYCTILNFDAFNHDFFKGALEEFGEGTDLIRWRQSRRLVPLQFDIRLFEHRK